MVLFTAVGIFVVVIALVKLFLFFRKGGTFTQVARNATHLYCQTMQVYPKIDDYTAMYVSLMINSCAARDKMPKELIRKIVKNTEECKGGWVDCVYLYTEIWFRRVCNTYYRFGVNKKLDKKLEDAVADATKDILENGSRRYEELLRSLSFFDMVGYTLQYQDGVC